MCLWSSLSFSLLGWKGTQNNRKQQCPHFRVLPFCIRCCPSGWYTTPPQDFFTTPGLFSHLANEKAETQAAELAQVTEWTSDKDRIWTPDRQASIPVLVPLSTQLSNYTMCLGRQEVSRNTGFFFFFLSITWENVWKQQPVASHTAGIQLKKKIYITILHPRKCVAG